MKSLLVLFFSCSALGLPPSYSTDNLEVEFTRNSVIVRNDKDVVCFIYELSLQDRKDLLANRDAEIGLYSENNIRILRDRCNVKPK